MTEKFERAEILLGKDAMDKLKKARVAVFGIGGVGGYAVEALVRTGLGEIDIIDNDKVTVSNINRQIIATCENIGFYKVDVMGKRIKEINPECKVNTYKTFFMPETSSEFDFTKYNNAVRKYYPQTKLNDSSTGLLYSNHTDAPKVYLPDRNTKRIVDDRPLYAYSSTKASTLFYI